MHGLATAWGIPVPDEKNQLEVSGIVKWFNLDRGFGFIVRPGKPDILLHGRTLIASGFGAPTDGATIRCKVSAEGRPCAVAVLKLGKQKTSLSQLRSQMDDLDARSAKPREQFVIERRSNRKLVL